MLLLCCVLLPRTPLPRTPLPWTLLPWTSCPRPPKISRFFVFSRPSFCFYFFQFRRSFVELLWSLRVFIIENVFTTHICVLWTSCETLAGKFWPPTRTFSPGPPTTFSKTAPTRTAQTTPHLDHPYPDAPSRTAFTRTANHTPTFPNPPWWNTGGRTSWTQKVFLSVVFGKFFSSGNNFFFEVGPSNISGVVVVVVVVQSTCWDPLATCLQDMNRDFLTDRLAGNAFPSQHCSNTPNTSATLSQHANVFRNTFETLSPTFSFCKDIYEQTLVAPSTKLPKMSGHQATFQAHLHFNGSSAGPLLESFSWKCVKAHPKCGPPSPPPSRFPPPGHSSKPPPSMFLLFLGLGPDPHHFFIFLMFFFLVHFPCLFLFLLIF